MKFTVHLADPEEVFSVDVDARDRRAFEMQSRRVFGTAADGQLRTVATSMPENYSYWCAWHALCKRGTVALTWEQFDARAVHLESDDSEDDDADPTQPGHTPG